MEIKIGGGELEPKAGGGGGGRGKGGTGKGSPPGAPISKFFFFCFKKKANKHTIFQKHKKKRVTPLGRFKFWGAGFFFRGFFPL